MRGLLLLIPLLLCGRLCVAAPWIRITTPEFELFTDAGEQIGRDAIAHFEQVRSFFLQASPVRPVDQAPVRIIIFHGREELAPYAPNRQVVAYFTSDERRDYIVMADGSPESYPVAIHEYTHLIIRRSGLHVPVWLNEGWSEVYSSLRPVHDGVAVGDLLPGRMRVLAEGKWLSLEALGAVDQASPIYNEGDRAGIFYAESWALAHMLFLSPDYKNGFPAFVAGLHRGKSLTQALEGTYRRSPEQVFRDLREYFNRKKLYGAVFKTAIDRSKAPLTVSDVSAPESKLVLAELQRDVNHLPQAGTMLDELRSAEPGNPEVAEASGYLEVRKNNAEAARQYFETALKNGGTNPKMCFALARLEQLSHQPPAKAIRALERAVQLRPDYVEAQIELGLLQIAARDFPAAINTLTGIQKVKSELAPAVYSGLAYAALQTGDLEQARKYVETARKWVRTPQEKGGVDQLSGFIEARALSSLGPRPGELIRRVEGTITNLVCESTGNHLNFEAGDQSLELLVPDAKTVEFVHPGGGTLQLTCGPQKPLHMALEYAVRPGGLGILRRIEY